jgi:hypothetical protein
MLNVIGKPVICPLSFTPGVLPANTTSVFFKLFLDQRVDCGCILGGSRAPAMRGKFAEAFHLED